MSNKKHVFEMRPGKELSERSGGVLHWPEFDHLKSVRKVELISPSKENKALELPINANYGLERE